MELNRKTALVTGGGRGIGKAICRTFAEKGAGVIVSDQDPDLAGETAGEIRQQGGRALGLALDVSDSEDFERAIEKTRDHFPSIHIWVNNAGIGDRAMLHQMEPAQWDRVMNINLRGAFLGTRLAARLMMPQGWGRIINISSRAAKGGSYGHANYAASKAGLIGLTKSSARELGQYNITVNAILPGFIHTDLTKNLDTSLTRPEEVVMPQPGKPEDVAYAAAFLASEEAGWITGICLEVTGGSGMFSG